MIRVPFHARTFSYRIRLDTTAGKSSQLLVKLMTV